MGMNTSNNKTRLMEALVAGHEIEYRTNAWFHSVIHQLADLLPVMVDGFALKAQQMDLQMQETLLKIQQGTASFKMKFNDFEDD